MKAHVLNAFFSLVFAILILSAAASHLTTNASYTVPITITAPEQVEISYGDQSGNQLTLKEVVTVVVRGPSELIERHRQRGTIKGDFTVPQEDVDAKRPLNIEVIKKRIPDGLTLESVTPSTLDLTYSRRGSRKVYVSAGQIIGKPAPGYRIGNVTCTKNLVSVEGDVALLDKYPGGSQDNLYYKTQAFDLATRGSPPRSTITVQLAVAPPDPSIHIAETVGVRIEIIPELVEEEIEFPIKFVRNPGEGDQGVTPLKFRITTKLGPWTRRIKLRGPQATLASIRDAIRADIGTGQVPIAYVEDTDLTASEGNDDNLTIELRGLPEGVSVVNPNDLILQIHAERPN